MQSLSMPNSVESERALLRCLFDEPDLLYSGKPVKSSMFFMQENAIVFNALCELIQDSVVPEETVVKNYLMEKGLYEIAGENSLFALLKDTEYSVDNYNNYVSRLFDTFISREIIRSGSRISDSGRNLQAQEALDVVVSESERIIDISNLESSTGRIYDLMIDEWQALEERVESDGLTGISTGFDSYDLITGGFQKSDEVIIAARPSVGKTSLALRWMLNAATDGVPCAFFSYEMSESQIMQRFLSMQSGVNLTKIRNGVINEAEYQKVADAAGEVADLPIYINKNTSSSVEEVSRETVRLVRKQGVEIVVVDYLQLIPHRTEYATQDIGSMARSLKNLAMSNDIVSIVISQLNRQVEQRGDKRPILSDLRQSGNIEEHADQVLMLYREEMYAPNEDNRGKADLLIRKHRNGAIGTLPLRFNAECADFKPAGI